MKYVFDSDSLINLFRHYYELRFPTLWVNFDALVKNQRVVSVKEVSNELADYGDRLSAWAKRHSDSFKQPTASELEFVKTIFKTENFRSLIREKQKLQGKPVADPFVIAHAKVFNCCVVTQERRKEGVVKIPSVCDHFGIKCVDLEGFMEIEKWKF